MSSIDCDRGISHESIKLSPFNRLQASPFPITIDPNVVANNMPIAGLMDKIGKDYGKACAWLIIDHAGPM